MSESDGHRRLAVHSQLMRESVELCRLYAEYRRSVLFLGPVGAGKTALARMLYDASGLPGEFVTIASGDLVESLYADTLFGHARGAYTGADTKRMGAIAEAANGVLLLDDLALMALSAQAAILRALETHRYRPLGATRDERADCRMLFASTVCPKQLVVEGRMLPDLESRLGNLVVPVPALRERSEDIIPLAQSFAVEILREHRIQVPVTIVDDSRELLLSYDWPGNVRELRSVMERAVIHARARDAAVIRPVHLPHTVRCARSGEPAGPRAVSAAEMQRMLDLVRGNRSEAARRLGMHRNTLARRLRSSA